MRIEFGIWDHFEKIPGIPDPQQYRDKIELLRQAEHEGYYGYHIAEHHLSPLDLAPSPNVFLSALAQATSKLKIGSMVHILPLYHPTRLIQEVCMLDNISGGRFMIGVGKGARAVEHRWFEIDPKEAAGRNEEMLRILISALTSGNLAYDGKYYKLPAAPIPNLPVQRPYPPIWYAGSPEFSGRHGLNLLTRSLDMVQRYWQLWDENHDAPHRMNPGSDPLVGIVKHIVVRNSRDEAMDVGRRAWKVFTDHWTATPLGTVDGREVPPRNDKFDEIVGPGGSALAGTPDQIIDFLRGVLRGVAKRPTFYFGTTIQWGDITKAEAQVSMQLLAREVLPALREEFGVFQLAES